MPDALPSDMNPSQFQAQVLAAFAVRNSREEKPPPGVTPDTKAWLGHIQSADGPHVTIAFMAAWLLLDLHLAIESPPEVVQEVLDASDTLVARWRAGRAQSCHVPESPHACPI